ncbi:WhiB family redox-sensing transcriptional regulator [Sediminihabitans luteus]|uniref:Transcriptional regulator WhiB n=1 Tax=Sediminihabitans luteus TaxID=1138585 RepID=A0A2M9CYX9_9CELL|nr:WhiB family transcriptional regulator [Sediminihabitans luteus]PJJ77097.1 WhiB family redox-sensing transcriptional regulator [Sediminihabitans luteus]GIJ00384.1 hypothetical protein Slu03_27610 [Sediminihabitans luteus]
MRLTALLDTLTTEGGSGPWTTTSATPPVTARPASTGTQRAATQPRTTERLAESAEFDRLLAEVLPCRTNDPELWFAERARDVEQAKALCQDCPLRAGCLAGAIEREEPWGVWGGEVFVDGAVVARKRGRGRPSKAELLERAAEAEAAAQAASAVA